MLVLDSSSNCDVCLEPYTDTRVPHVINCGHTFCLRCLQLLTRQICPLCRRDFEPVHVRRLHTDKGNSRPTTPSAPSGYELDEPSAHARNLQSRISRIVLDGAASVDVLNTLEDVNEWLQGQPPKEYPDLEAAYFLLRRYAELQRKCAERKAGLIASQEECDDLREKLHAAQDACHELKEELSVQEEMAQARYQELERLRADERQAYKNIEADLREQLARQDRNWNGRYEVCLKECKRLADAVRECERNHRNPLPVPPRYDVDSRPYPQPSPQQEDMVLVHEKADERPEPTNTLKIDIGGEENMFHVSPVSPIAPALPIPPLASETFRALSDDIPDSEDERVPSRHAKPIPIKSSLHRAGSSRLKYEDPAARSLPRSLIDVHMASCSSSPSVSNLHAAIRERRVDAGPSGQDSLNLTRYIDSLDMTEEERQVRRRAQLQEVLHDPTVKTSSISGSGAPSSIHRTPAPVIPPPPPTRSNTVRWASEAAKAAERARAASIHTSSSHSLSQAYVSPTSPSASRTPAPRTPSPTSHTSATRPPSPTRSPVSATRLRPQQMRTASTDSLKAMRIPANASGLTRTFLVQEAHAQRVS